MKRKIPEIKESQEYLRSRVRSEKNVRRRQRLSMLYLLKSKQAKTLRGVAGLLAVSRNTVGRWLSCYEREGIERMLEIHTRPNRPLSIPPDILNRLKEQLQNPKGFSSYKEIRLWLLREFGLDIKYKTLHKIVLYTLKAKLKVPRRSHIKKDKQEAAKYKENFTQTLKSHTPGQESRQRIRIFSEDETRLGLKTIQRKRITLKGVKPVGVVQDESENYYLYGVEEPTTGDAFFLELPAIDSQCFQVLLNEFSQPHADSLNVIALDGAKAHRAHSLQIPDNIILEFLPAYSPELNPIERLWEDLKNRIAYETFGNLQALKDRVAGILKSYSTKIIKSLTGYPYFVNAVNALI